jgi:murein DD-endopeptidase MepM/ murein hydrolase activator NlpD
VPGHRRSRPIHGSPWLRLVGAGSALVALALPGPASATGPSITPRGLAGQAALGGPATARYFVAASSYYRPVITGGRAFPVARSNFFDLVEFPNSWHDPRLRLISGRWLLVGVHEGIDITAERGTPVLSMIAGVVERVGWTFYCGTRVGVRGTDGRYYLYCHLAQVAPAIAPGARVVAGSLLGRVGNTGYGSDTGHRDEFAPHLHFGVQAAHDGPWVNPYSTLVALYSATVRADHEAQAAVDRLSRSGDRSAWARAVDRLYMGLSPW